MKRILLLAVLLLGACAPEVPTMAETSGGEAAGAKSEALLAACGQTSLNRAIATMNHKYACNIWSWDNTYTTESTNSQCSYNGKTRRIRIAGPVNLSSGNWCAYTIYRSKSGPNTDDCRWWQASCDSTSSADCLLQASPAAGNPSSCAGYN